MAAFRNLEDSPMFRNEIYSLEQTADELEDRCQKLHRGCKRFMTSLYEAYDGDLAFANCLDAFGAGQDDPTSVTIGGPVMSKFTAAFRELGTYKELLCSQMEYMLSDRLMQFMSVDLQNVKDCRRRFDKATAENDQAREKFMSLKKSTRAEVVLENEEDLHNSKSAFERCRFNLVNALANIEAKKKYEFLESISAVMDAHMRYFKKGYELLSQMGPFIDEVLTYALHSREMANTKQDKLAKRILEFRTQSELANLRSSSNVDASSSGDGIHVIGINPYKNIEALMQSTANGQVQTIKQGYLLKQPSNLRGDWKRRFFILDSHGTLYYYGNKWSKKLGPLSQRSAGASECAGVFGRTHQRTSSPVEDNIGYHTVDLQTSKIKIDAEQTDLRFCFRIISPAKTYTLQAESAAEQMDWVENITGVIASLLNSFFLMKLSSGESNILSCSSADANDPGSLPLEDRTGVEIYDDVSRLLRCVPGNDVCAECGSPEPDWASLNLGILVCIECSGVHRNLGVHISKVRSLTLDVKVWEPIVVDLFRALGNAYCNSVWEEFLPSQDERMDESNMNFLSIQKPGPNDTVLEKEKYINSKYVDKLLIKKETTLPVIPPQAIHIWDAVKSNDIRGAYRLLVASNASPNTRYGEVSHDLYHTANTPMSRNSAFTERKQFDPANCQKINDSGEPESCMQGCSLLHLACHVADPVMLELLLQFGADINIQDLQGRTPLHHCILKKNNSLAKYLIKRGVDASIKDGGGLTALERAMELGAVIDEELLMLLSGND